MKKSVLVLAMMALFMSVSVISCIEKPKEDTKVPEQVIEDKTDSVEAVDSLYVDCEEGITIELE